MMMDHRNENDRPASRSAASAAKKPLIEVLYPELGNLYGESGNALYLKKCLPGADFRYTQLASRPAFAEEQPDLILMGAMSEDSQQQAVRRLQPYRGRLSALMDAGVPMLFTGNAGEVLFEQVETWNKTSFEGLGLLPFRAKANGYTRYNGLTYGVFQDSFDTFGFRSQFTFWYGDNAQCPFVRCKRGIGLNPDSSLEGILKNRTIVTAQLGPLLVNNPQLTRTIFGWMGVESSPVFEKEILAAQKERLKDFEAPGTKFTL